MPTEDAQSQLLQDKIYALIEQNIVTNDKFEAYRDFVDLEEIVSCVRFHHARSESLFAVFFVNFNCQVDLDNNTRLNGCLLEANNWVRDHLDSLGDTDRDYSKSIRQIIQILNPIADLAADKEPRTPGAFFQKLLASVMTAMEIGDNGFATLHLLHPDTTDGTLELCASTIECDTMSATLQAYRGDGVVSWVVLNKKAVLIKDMSTSIFNRFHCKHTEQHRTIRSELAVPLLVAGEVIGVLNIEHDLPDAFEREDVHTLSYAAAQAALAFTLSQNSARAVSSERRISELLDLGLQVANTGARDDKILGKLATLLQQWLSPDFVEVWLYDSVSNTFSHAGATYATFQRNRDPRRNGTSAFIVDNRMPIWLSDFRSDRTYQCDYWSFASNEWTNHYSDAAHQLPPTINPIVLEERISCELGVNIDAHGQCIGVIWLKYAHPVPQPSPQQMSLITKLAGQIAIIVDSMIQLEQREEREIRRELVSDYFSVGDQKNPRMAGYVLYQPVLFSTPFDLSERIRGFSRRNRHRNVASLPENGFTS